MANERGNWTGGYGFTIAAIGSAVGLGNLWRFPYLAGMNGGGAFVLLYLFLIMFLGVSLLLAEFSIGRHGGCSPVGAFRRISSKFVFAGFWGVLSCCFLLSFYGVVGGWTLYFLIHSFFVPVGQMGECFELLSSSIWRPLVFQLAFMLLSASFVYRGISRGIEKANRFLMPMLFVMLLIVVVHSLTLPGAKAGVKFLFTPDFTKITPAVVIAAMGQVFFSLSVGATQMMTYASYLGKEISLPKSSLTIACCDTFVSLLAGLAILPAVFAFGAEPSQGPGLLFVTLPSLFAQISGGVFFCILFFLLIVFAALSSSISMLEVPVAFLVDEHGYSRGKAIALSGGLITLMGSLCVLSLCGVLNLERLFGMNLFEILDYLTNNIMLPVGGLWVCLVVGYIWGAQNAFSEITQGGVQVFRWKKIWFFIVKYLAPIMILLIFIYSLGLLNWLLPTLK